MAFVNFKIPDQKLRDKVRFAAEDFLKRGMTEQEAAQAIVESVKQCAYHQALAQVQWVKVYQFSRYSKK